MADFMVNEPHITISAQELLKQEPCTHCGWLRKRGKINLIAKHILKWSNMYVVLSRGCLYYFKSEMSKNPAGAFSLYGYNMVMRAGDVLQSEAPWAFKIVHASPLGKTYYLSAASEPAMKEWMKILKNEMLIANGKRPSIRSIPDGRDDKKEDEDSSSETYDQIESGVYDDGHTFVPKELQKVECDSDEEAYLDMDDDPTLTHPSWLPPVEHTHTHTHNHPKAGKGLPEQQKQKPVSIPRSPEGNVKNITSELNKKLAMQTPQGNRPIVPKKPADLAQKIAQTESKPKVAERPPAPLPQTKLTDEKPQIPERKKPGVAGRPRPQGNSFKGPKLPERSRMFQRESMAYWDSVYFHGTDREAGNQILRNIGEEGVFLVRQSGEPKGAEAKTLVVYACGVPKKYKIVQNGDFFHIQEGFKFESIPELLYYYYENNLPNYDFTLKRPYSQPKD